MTHRIENLHQRPLNQMVPGQDTVYAQRVVGGFEWTFFGTLVSVSRGVVTLRGGWEGVSWPDGAICGANGWPRCHWFRDTKTPAE